VSEHKTDQRHSTKMIIAWYGTKS